MAGMLGQGRRLGLRDRTALVRGPMHAGTWAQLRNQEIRQRGLIDSHTHASAGEGGTTYGDLFVTHSDGAMALDKSDGSHQFTVSHAVEGYHFLPNEIDGGFLVAANEEKIRVCAADGAVNRTIDVPVHTNNYGGGHTSDIHADSALLIVNNFSSGNYETLNYSDGSLNTTIRGAPHKGCPCAFSPDGSQLAVYVGQTQPAVYDVDGTHVATGADHGGFVARSVDISPSYVVAGGDSGQLYCYNRSDMSTRWTQSYSGTNPRINVQINADETLVFVACDYDVDGTEVSTIKAWDASGGQLQYSVQLTAVGSAEGNIGIFNNVLYSKWDSDYQGAHDESDLSEIWLSNHDPLSTKSGRGRPALAVT